MNFNLHSFLTSNENSLYVIHEARDCLCNEYAQYL